jgi:hypothetical protein
MNHLLARRSLAGFSLTNLGAVAGNALASAHVALNHYGTLRTGHSLLGGSLLRTFLRNSSFNGHFVFLFMVKDKKK